MWWVWLTKKPTLSLLWILISQTNQFVSTSVWTSWTSGKVCERGDLGGGSHLLYNVISAPFREVWSTRCWNQLLKRVSYLRSGCWCCWNWCSAQLLPFCRARQCPRLWSETESAALQDWELQRNSQSYRGFIKLIKITSSPKWATALHTLCFGSRNSESVIPSHNSSEKPQIESSCHHVCKGERALHGPQFPSQTGCSYRFTPFGDGSGWVRGSSNLLRNRAKDQSLQKTQNTQTDWEQHWFILSDTVSGTAKPYYTTVSSDRQWKGRSCYQFFCEIYSLSPVPLLTPRLPTQVLSKSWISDISNTKYL